MTVGSYVGCFTPVAHRGARPSLEAEVADLITSTQSLSALPPLVRAMAERLIRQRLVVQDQHGRWRRGA